jgi:hypothetical protein
MDINILNIILVASFGFVSVALGVRWLGQTYIDWKLAKLGMIIERFENGKLIGEEEDDNTSS